MDKIVALMSALNELLMSGEPITVSSLRRALKISTEQFIIDARGVTSFIHCRVLDNYIDGSVVYTSQDSYICLIIENGESFEKAQWPALNGIAPTIESSKTSREGYNVEYVGPVLWYGASLNSQTNQLESLFSKHA